MRVRRILYQQQPAATRIPIIQSGAFPPSTLLIHDLEINPH